MTCRFLWTVLFLSLLGIAGNAIAPVRSIVLPSLAQGSAPKTILPADLPSRFDPAPAFLQKIILNSIAALNPDFKREGIVLEEAATFIDLEQAEIVMGLTANLPNVDAIKKFDAGLRSPDSQQIFIEGLKKSLSSFGKVEITQVKELSTVNKLGQIARGFAIEAKLPDRGLTISTESVAFRRGNTGILVILGAIDHPLTSIRAADLALRLDRRLLSK